MGLSPTRWIVVALLAVMVAPVLAQEAAYDWVGDHYPKNPGVDILNYRFEIELTEGSDRIDGLATVLARFEEAGQSVLRLDLVGRSGRGDGMTVDSVTSGGRMLEFEHRDDRLFIDLGRDVELRELIEVSVAYGGAPATGLILGPTRHGGWSIFSDNWSSRARNWLPTVDHLYDKATSEFIVTAPSRMQVTSNGVLVERSDLGGGRRLTHWRNSVPISPWLFALGAAEFAVQYVDDFEGKPIETWVYWQDRDAGFYDFAVPTKQALAYFSDLIGPFTYERLANVQSNSVGGGMEAATSIFYGDNSVTGDRSFRWQRIIVHEVAHQWFGNSVTEAEWNHLWLSEGFASYYTLLFIEHAYGRDAFIHYLNESRDEVFNYYANDYDFQIIRDTLPDLNDVSGWMIYRKGAWTLHMLRELLGPEVYDEAIRRYYHEFNGRTALTGDLRKLLEEASGRDLDQFFAQWLHQGGVPTLEAIWSAADGVLNLTIEQVQPTYRFWLPVDIDVRLADGSVQRVNVEVPVEGRLQTSIPVDGDVAGVDFDPDTRLLARWN